MGLEPLFQAWSYFRRRKFRQCSDLCSQLLEKPPGEQEPDSEYTVFQEQKEDTRFGDKPVLRN